MTGKDKRHLGDRKELYFSVAVKKDPTNDTWVASCKIDQHYVAVRGETRREAINKCFNRFVFE